jgi:gluconokinase
VGAALMGLKALGHIENFSDANYFTQISHIFKPNAAHHKAYDEMYDDFTDWAEILDKKSKGKLSQTM